MIKPKHKVKNPSVAIKNNIADTNEKFKVWWDKYGYKHKPETEDEKGWCVIVRYWAWIAYKEASINKSRKGVMPCDY